MAFDKLADGIIRHHKVIIVAWVVILICAIYPALHSGSVMDYDTADMAGNDSESVKGMVVIQENFMSSMNSEEMPVLVIKYSSPEERQMIEGDDKNVGLIDALNNNAEKYVLTYTDKETGEEKTVPKLSEIMGPFIIVDSTESAEVGVYLVAVFYNTTIVTDKDGVNGMVNVEEDTSDLRAFISSIVKEYPGVEAYLTGSPAIGYDTSTGATGDIQRIDPLTVLLILVLVGLFFRSFITSATPPITIGFAFVVVLGIIYMLGTFVMNIFFITEIMLLVSMMGAGCDYCIFIIARYKEELKSGKDHDSALREAIKWAGESIAVSGASVIIGFGAMSICSFEMVSTMGICLAIGILIALLAALTLIPSILAITRDRIFWPSTMAKYDNTDKCKRGWHHKCGQIGHRYFERSSRFSLKHAGAITLVAVLVTAPAAYITLTSETSYDMIGAMENGDSGTGMDLIGEYANEGMLMPDYVLLEYETPFATVDLMPEIPNVPIRIGLLTWDETQWPQVYAGLAQLKGMMESYDAKDGKSNIGDISLPVVWSALIGEIKGQFPSATPEQIVSIIKQQNMMMGYVLDVVETMFEMIEIGIFEALGIDPEKIGYDPGESSAEFVLEANELMDYLINVQMGTLGGSFVNLTGHESEDPAPNVTYVKLSVQTVDGSMTPRSMDTISNISKAVDKFHETNTDIVATWITGSAVVMYEVSEVIMGEFNNIEILVIVLIIILLFVVMRSYTIPFRSVLTILMSICWTLAMTHIVFVNILGGEVMWLVPLILLIICLGLGMDYDILLTTRIKENVRSKGMTNDEAIHQAVLSTGAVITICGLIMGGAFGTLMLSSMEMLQEFGFALCFAILVDALVVRTYIVPAVMHLLGDWNWKGPGFKSKKEPAPEEE